MANIVKPKLNDVGKLDLKTYVYNQRQNGITNEDGSSKLFNVSDEWLDNFASKTNHSYAKSIIEAALIDIIKEGPLQSFFEQFHIFDDVSDEEVETDGNPEETTPTEGGTDNTPPEEEQEDPKPDNNDSDNNSTDKPYGDLDMTNYPDGQYDRAAAKERSILVAKYLVNEGGFTKEQAAAMVGVFWDENGCYPGEVMREEYNANQNSYGAGIGSWTDRSFKNQCLADAGLPANTPIESLTMQQQCDMIIATSQKSMKNYYNALKRCDNIEDASATAVCITGGVGFSSHWSTHPTSAEAASLANWYAERNDRMYGYSSYHHNLDQRRLSYAREILAEL